MMPGRPRTKLKLIATWEQRAEQLYEDIRRRTPAQHVDYDIDFEKYRDSEYPSGPPLISFDNVPNFDPVAYEWKLVLQGAEELKEHLQDLQIVIRQRLKRNGVRLDQACAATKPDDGHDPDESEAIDAGDPPES